MEPQHVSAQDLLAETFHFQQRELLGLDKRDDGTRSPVANRVEIDREIALPLAAHRIPVAFARTEGDSYPSEACSGSYGGDLQRVGQGCLFQFTNPACRHRANPNPDDVDYSTRSGELHS